MTVGWSAEELEMIGRANEIQVSSYRPDGTLRPFITIWVVRAGEDLWVRSAHGPENGWFRRAINAGAGRIRAAGIEHNVRFVPRDVTDATQESIDVAYHGKYDGYGPRYVNTVVGDLARETTLCLTPDRPAQ